MSRGRVGRGVWAMIAEATMVVFAVLVALAVDEWREDREIDALVARAQVAVDAELRSNQEEVQGGKASVQAMHDSVAGWVRRIRAGDDVPSRFLGGEIPEFSDAAWETARVTGALAHMPYQRVLRVARTYDTQELAQMSQARLFDGIGAVVAKGLEIDVLTDLQGQLFIVLQIYAALEARYAEVLDGS